MPLCPGHPAETVILMSSGPVVLKGSPRLAALISSVKLLEMHISTFERSAELETWGLESYFKEVLLVSLMTAKAGGPLRLSFHPASAAVFESKYYLI